MGFIRFRTVCTVLLFALLLVLFWVPQHMLTERAAEWTAQMDRAENAIQNGDFAAAQAECGALRTSFSECENALERFLNHDDVDAVLTSLSQANTLAAIGDASGTLAALSDARGQLLHLLCIEQFTWNALL